MELANLRFPSGGQSPFLLIIERESEHDGFVRVTIAEQDRPPYFLQVVDLALLRKYRHTKFAQGALTVSYLHARDQTRLDFGPEGPASLILGREAFEALLASV
ncbi:hypothetical protein [Fimbriimonas ginsengisoli]|uniref:Uncharacterized protein n=1 Tax=Fimbriimonas ginsengisoli Gsoil 348 TaxID=661478 RepID=A0A068NXL0_FIMGI|nr:hypothetical protein [Fimbriimonas ginsengisoli]AIE87495.1 hypothetical protein OP10G_4127 [Fimbriimonas ginsengisoli Gsoil 348]